jgi:aerobic carbon-monoxide dehydrogenase small subunit
VTDRPVTLTVNGARRSVGVDPAMTLLDMVRDRFELTGSKECCGEGECGACTMILDGAAVNSCLVLAVEADGAEITTIEGIGGGGLTPLQEGFLAAGAIQCGFCIPGMVVAATALLERIPVPTERDVREGLSGNLCRCGGYSFITDAVLESALAGGSHG